MGKITIFYAREFAVPAFPAPQTDPRVHAAVIASPANDEGKLPSTKKLRTLEEISVEVSKRSWSSVSSQCVHSDNFQFFCIQRVNRGGVPQVHSCDEILLFSHCMFNRFVAFWSSFFHFRFSFYEYSVCSFFESLRLRIF